MSQPKITLRPIQPEDIPLFYAMETDEASRQMAAFGPPPPVDPAAYTERWQRMLSNPEGMACTILADGEVAGYVLKFIMFGEDTVAYWIARSHWGKGIATAALGLLLAQVRERPLYARAASDNLGSRRVLEKCGFVVIAEETNFAEARKANTPEVIMRLNKQV
jgi:RimJ/RimL family protein N-acetyltransferase